MIIFGDSMIQGYQYGMFDLVTAGRLENYPQIIQYPNLHIIILFNIINHKIYIYDSNYILYMILYLYKHMTRNAR